ncbi:metal ABC transporter permease [Desulfovibrio mangrovi]|uniref:metal ABC transporter permease n=1 Tax=Desulfovibrio mangrovi TaxID=2976983 RepID=UPI00224591E8|nr:metal ABC transporter permease [Desulfovibrio mangrovi]UZP68650.1 metal ABC transporter permease [Desulfovibrio mangrovi]
MWQMLSFDFMQYAILAGILASIACGIVGSLVVVNRLVFLAGGVAHAAYGGVGLAFYFGLPVLPCTVGFSLSASMLMAGVSLRYKEKADTAIGVLWAAGMAFGIILLDLTPGYNVDLMSFLFGSILAVPAQDLWLMAVLDTLVVLATAYFYPGLLLLSFDREFARARGLAVTFLHCLMIGMAALTVVMIIRVVGLILVIALLTIPPFMAQRTAKSLAGMMMHAIGWSILFCLGGLTISYHFDITSGASIIAVAAVCFFTAMLADALRRSLANGKVSR